MPPSFYKFGEFELDSARYELRRQGKTLKLERIPMELLILLAEGDGHVVSRQAIVERLWGKDVFVDTEHGINTAIRKIRTALREDGERPRFVQTVQGKGYRFVTGGQNGNAGTMAGPDADPAPAAALEPAPPPEPTAVAKGGRRSRWAIVGMAVFLLAGSLLAFNVGGIRDRLYRRDRGARIQSIAVLPLANLSGDAAQDYFADGMTDELITMLTRHSSLRVASRTSAMQYKGARRPLPEIARELGVDAILEGSLERSGNRVHLTVQLIDAATDTHVWAQSYDRSFNDALSLPSELSQTIAREVRQAAAPAAPERPVSPEAHDAYLHGRYLWLDEDYDRSQEYFEKAIALQPDYAAAWSGLADTYTVRAVATLVPPQDVMAKAKAAALKAVALDASVGEAHVALAAVHFFGDWDLKAADEEVRRGIELSPNYAEARHLHCYILVALNRLDESVQEQRRSSEMDPFARPWALGLALIRQRQLDAAVDELRRRVEAQPLDGPSRFFLAEAYWHKGMWKEYAEEREKGFRAVDEQTSADATRHAFASGGQTGVAEWILAQYKARARKGYMSPWDMARAWARVGRKEETLGLLEAAYREHSAPMVFLQHEAIFDFLHADERYRAIVKKTGFPPAF